MANKWYYAAHSSMGLSYTYDSPCWTVLAFGSAEKRDNYVKTHDNTESVDGAKARKIAPELRNKSPYGAWRVSVID